MQAEKWLDYCARQTTERLWEGLKRLHERESRSLPAILAHLAELDHRHAAEEKAYPSLFAYCTRELGYSEAEALLRIRSARAARRFPRILTMIARRQIHVTAVARLWPHLTPENYRSVLAKASRRTLEELDRLLAALAPQAERRPVIRALSAGSDAPPVGTAGKGEISLWAPPSAEAATGGAAAAAAQSGGVEAASETTMAGDQAELAPKGRVLFHFVAGEALRAKFRRARELLWHKYPSGRPEQVFDDALEALLQRKDPSRRLTRRRGRAQFLSPHTIPS